MADCEEHSFIHADWLTSLNALHDYDQEAAVAELDAMADRELIAYWSNHTTRDL